jgi:MscS family membrane protein
VDDYIHLQDRTLGKVESIGWRSTKIRLSGKNTLAVIPNSNLVKENIENLTRAKRVISMITLTFFSRLSENEKALIQEFIFQSTDDILGIDSELTQVNFKDVIERGGDQCVRADIIFFILGAADTSMELRRGLLEIARDNIVNRLEIYGIAFNCEQTTVDVPQEMTI